jgi:hypothetical protein
MIRAGALAALITTIGFTPATAQVRAVIQVNVGQPPVVYAAPRPIIVRRAVAPNVIYVERMPHRGRGWWKSGTDTGRQSFIPMVGHYYNTWVRRPGVTQVTVYTRDGRYLMDARGY